MCPRPGSANGPTPYLPLHLEPEIERQIERVLILGGVASIRRPIAAATLLRALPKACQVDAETCEAVRLFLSRYIRSPTLLFASGGVAAGSSNAHADPDAHGERADSRWDVAAQAAWQPIDHVLLTAGVVAYDGRTTADGTMLSIGNEYMQLDAGVRDRWWSPLEDSSMVMSTEAPSLPSVTLSNYQPMTRLGFEYEVFAQRMSRSAHILDPEGTETAGTPQLAGAHLGIEPVPGWSFGVNRVIQYGGGAAGGSSFHSLIDALVHPSSAGAGLPTQFGNQQASIVSRFLFPGPHPFSVSVEYAGEDTSRARNYLLGNSSLSVGIDVPHVWRQLDLRYEISEWQNAWYVNSIFLDGMMIDGNVTGHWGADNRVFGDGVGARAQSLHLGWDAPRGQTFSLDLRTVANQSYSANHYHTMQEATLRYSRPVGAYRLGAEADGGRDVFGDHFGYMRAFLQYGTTGNDGSQRLIEVPETSGGRQAEGAFFVDLGASVNRLKTDLAPERVATWQTFSSPHVGFGARRAVTDHSDLGVRAELDEINSHALLTVRALDYRYRFNNPLALSAFFGFGRYDLATPAYGYVYGVGAQWRLRPRWDLNVDVRYGDSIARDHLRASDPVSIRPDSFYTLASTSAYLSWHW